MNEVCIEITNLKKKYRLGQLNSGTLSQDLVSFWSRILGKEDPNLIIEENIISKKKVSEYIWAIDNVSLKVTKGEILGVIGQNGAGKSTLLKILSRITSPTSGSIKIKGRIASLLEVGTGFHPELTGYENIYTNGAILGMKKIEIDTKINEIINFSGIAKYIDTPVKRYSTGMRVRLAFAVAAHLDPEILLIDEVLAVGDANFQEKCINRMGKISNEGRTIIFVSHQLDRINELCDRCVVLEKGTIVYEGHPNKAIDFYLSNGKTLEKRGLNSLVGFKSDFSTELAKFTKIQISGIDEDPKFEFYFKEKIKIKLWIEILEDLKNCVISLMIGDRRGKRILYSESKRIGSFSGDIQKGMHLSCTEIATDFLPGDFSVYIGLGDENGKTFEWLERVIDFNVIKTSLEKKSNYPWESVHGYVIEDSKWEISKIKNEI